MSLHRVSAVLAASVAVCWLSVVPTVSSQSDEPPEINCIWSEDICIPDPTTLDPAELQLALDGIAAIRDCSEQLQDTSGGTPPGCILDSSTCTTVDFVDSSGIGACAPVGHTWTDGETYVTTVLAWSECLDGKGTNCEQVAQDYMGGYTGCASCGETAYIVSLGFRECGWLTAASCAESVGGRQVDSGVPPTSVLPLDSPPSTVAPTRPATAGSASAGTGSIEATCGWGTTSKACIPIATGDDSIAWKRILDEYLECDEFNDMATGGGGCPACVAPPLSDSAPAACKTFFADSSAPTCLPAASVWTTVEEFKPDILWLSGIACPVATPECTASARSFAVNSGCPECADEAEAWNTAYDSCSVATTEAECTVSLPQGGSSSTGATPSTSASPAGGGTDLALGGGASSGASAAPGAPPTTPTGSTPTSTTDSTPTPTTDSADPAAGIGTIETGADTVDSPTDTTPTDTDTPPSTRDAGLSFPPSDDQPSEITTLPSAAPASMHRGVLASIIIGVFVEEVVLAM